MNRGTPVMIIEATPSSVQGPRNPASCWTDCRRIPKPSKRKSTMTSVPMSMPSAMIWNVSSTAKNHCACLNQLPGKVFSHRQKNQAGKILPNVTSRTSQNPSLANPATRRGLVRNRRSSVPRSRRPAIKPGKGCPPILRAKACSDPTRRRYA